MYDVPIEDLKPRMGKQYKKNIFKPWKELFKHITATTTTMGSTTNAGNYKSRYAAS
jgi:hypothetical protein